MVRRQEVEKVEGVFESALELVWVARSRHVWEVHADLTVDLVPKASGYKTKGFYVSVSIKQTKRTYAKLGTF